MDQIMLKDEANTTSTNNTLNRVESTVSGMQWSKAKKRPRLSAAIIIASAIILSPSASAFSCMRRSDVRGTNPRKLGRKEVQSGFSLSALSVDNPPSEMSDFQRRMRKLVVKESPVNKQVRRNNKIPKNFRVVKTLEDYKTMINGTNDCIIVVRFYAPWCKACKAIAPSFYRLATTYKSALFVDVPVTPDNANLHQGLGVPSLPFGHIYHPTGGLVEETKMSKKYFPHFSRMLKTYIEGVCDVGEDDEGPPAEKKP